MMEPTSINVLRERWRIAQEKAIGDEMIAFSELASHRDVTWDDLLQALARPGMIAEDAWLRLRTKLKDVEPAAALHLDSAFWRAVLEDHGISPQSRCNA